MLLNCVLSRIPWVLLLLLKYYTYFGISGSDGVKAADFFTDIIHYSRFHVGYFALHHSKFTSMSTYTSYYLENTLLRLIQFSGTDKGPINDKIPYPDII